MECLGSNIMSKKCQTTRFFGTKSKQCDTDTKAVNDNTCQSVS